MELLRIKSISAYHRFRNLPKPEHPLISLIDYSLMELPKEGTTISIVMDYYSIAMKKNIGSKLTYGQKEYDFDEGLMSFMAPGQMMKVEPRPDIPKNRSGYI